MTTIIHVNRQFIAINNKLPHPVLPTFIIRKGSKATYGFGVSLEGPVKMVAVSRTRKALKCGAKAWMETEGKVKIDRPMTYKEAKALLEKERDKQFKRLAQLSKGSELIGVHFKFKALEQEFNSAMK